MVKDTGAIEDLAARDDTASRQARESERHRRKLLGVSAVVVLLLIAGSLGVARAQQPTAVTSVPAAAVRPSEGPTAAQHPSGSPGASEPAGDNAGCHNSYDPKCGEFFWRVKPEKNLPLDVRVVVTPSSPRAGEPVTFAITARDPDLPIDRECVLVNYGDNRYEPAGCEFATCLERHGPWTPPPRQPDRLERSFTHTYATPGTYQVQVGVKSKLTICENPYESTGTQTVSVTVG
jgi:hypothetical protein